MLLSASHHLKVFALKTALILFSAFSFLGYGSACFFSSRMKQEFLRYRLASQRIRVGALQWFAGVGLLAGISQPWIGQAAAGGLALKNAALFMNAVQKTSLIFRPEPRPSLRGTVVIAPRSSLMMSRRSIESIRP